ncbi:MAG: alginate lyase family protein [Pseudomonadota bacterium]|nr:alginate lyase family protein [Pseudomonadota bacterium]
MRPALAALLVAALAGSGGTALAAPDRAAGGAVHGRDQLPGWNGGALQLSAATRARVVEEANRAVVRPPCPVVQLAGAGSDDLVDPQVIATRAAFEDADDAVILALAWRSTGESRYRDAVAARLVAWARTNVPTGHPIDETRLDSLVQAYVLVREALSPQDDAVVRAWFTELRERKRAWRFGPRTSVNNHRTHQLKMLLLLDEAMGDDAAFAADRAAAEAHAARNLDATTGESVDLRERSALYYHAYDLDAWLEILLLTRCCAHPVAAAYQLLERRLRDGDMAGEFRGSVSPLDAARARAGYGYGAAGSTFDPERAEHVRLAYGAFDPAQVSPAALAVTAASVQRRNLYSLARLESWHR